MKDCKKCGKSFEPKQGTQQFCSVKCRTSHYEQVTRKDLKASRFALEEGKSRACAWCEKEFTPRVPHEMYCSNNCKRHHRQWSDKVRQKDDGEYEFMPMPDYGSHGFDPIVANWMHRMTIPGSTLCGV